MTIRKKYSNSQCNQQVYKDPLWVVRSIVLISTQTAGNCVHRSPGTAGPTFLCICTANQFKSYITSYTIKSR